MAGADPSFTEVHVLRTLFLLDSEIMGRKRLVKKLGVGEGSVRTIIKRLDSEGLVSSSRRGHTLTGKGREEVAGILDKMSKPVDFHAPDLVSEGVQKLVVVYGAADRVGAGVRLRDTALKAGADGAVILVYDGVLRFPDGGIDLQQYPEALERLNKLDLSVGDVVVVGFAASEHAAEDGALAVAVELTGKT